MIKLVMCLYRKPELSREEFQDYWLNQHGPFFQENAETLKSRRYVQSHTIDSPLNAAMQESRGMFPEYDGIAEVWFESEEELLAAMTSPEGQQLGAELFADESNFVDHSRSTAFIVKEEEFD